MKELQRRQKLKQMLYSIPSLCLLVLIAFFLLKGAAGVLLKERESARRVADLESQALAVESRQNELREKIDRLKTDEGIVEEIREKFSATREGEYVAIIVSEEDLATTTLQSTGERLKGWWQGIKTLFDRD